jgi:hypothetical protein
MSDNTAVRIGALLGLVVVAAVLGVLGGPTVGFACLAAAAVLLVVQLGRRGRRRS